MIKHKLERAADCSELFSSVWILFDLKELDIVFCLFNAPVHYYKFLLVDVYE